MSEPTKEEIEAGLAAVGGTIYGHLITEDGVRAILLAAAQSRAPADKPSLCWSCGNRIKVRASALDIRALAGRLAPIYIKDHPAMTRARLAALCDEAIDPSGAVLGLVRDLAFSKG